MRPVYMKFLFAAFILCLSSMRIHSQTHLKLILKTNLPIDSALIVHFTDQESSWLAFKDTLEVDFKIAKTDFYHINYVRKQFHRTASEECI